MTDIDNIIWIDALWLDTLWNYLIEHQNCPFYTASGLPFSYTVKIGKDGKYNKELIIDRRTESKTLSFSSIRLAYENAMKLKGQIVERPKALGDIRGVSYIYPILYRMGVIEVPEKVKEKMEPPVILKDKGEDGTLVILKGKGEDGALVALKGEGEDGAPR